VQRQGYCSAVIVDRHIDLAGGTSELLLWYVTICQGAEVSEVKKAYRQLSLKYHPDRETGDPIKFMRISKAYNAYVPTSV